MVVLRTFRSCQSGSEWWGREPYWTEALHEISQAMQDGGRFVTIDVKKICKYLGKMNHSILDIFRHTDYLPSAIYSFGSFIQQK